MSCDFLVSAHAPMSLSYPPACAQLVKGPQLYVQICKSCVQYKSNTVVYWSCNTTTVPFFTLVPYVGAHASMTHVRLGPACPL